MAYILAVNPSILSTSGGVCTLPEYESDDCVDKLKRQMIVSTALTSALACIIMGAWANLPIALSCGMGMNAYFTFTYVGFLGTGEDMQS